jgi:hypothetical protein
MAARSCDLSKAFEWLEQRVMSKRPDIEIDLDKIVEAQDASNGDDGDHERKADTKEPPRRRINPRPLILPLERDIPRRQFLYGMHYMRGTVSGTIGTGGTGKSTLGLIEGIGMSVARDLLGNEKFKTAIRVWYHNAEETMEELVRRCAAICKHFGIPREQLAKHFLVTNGFETPIKVANGGRDVKIDATLRKEIIDVITEEKIDAVIFDPLVAMHRVHEDFNSALDPVIRDAFGKIAHDTNCAIDLCHHTRKKPAGHDGEYTVADSRGGQSFIDALRGARVLNTMSKTEATTAFRLARSVKVRKLLNEVEETKTGKRKPLTEEQIDERIDKMCMSPNDQAAATGIKLREERKARREERERAESFEPLPPGELERKLICAIPARHGAGMALGHWFNAHGEIAKFPFLKEVAPLVARAWASEWTRWRDAYDEGERAILDAAADGPLLHGDALVEALGGKVRKRPAAVESETNHAA